MEFKYSLKWSIFSLLKSLEVIILTEVTVTNLKLHSSGDQKKITATLTDISTGETFTVPHIRTIEDWFFSATSTAVALKGVISSGNVLTLTPSASGTQDGIIAVYGR